MTLEWGVFRVTLPILNLRAFNDISETAEATVVKFCTHEGYITFQPTDDKLPL